MAKAKNDKLAKTTKGGAITKWDEELAKHAMEAADKEQMPTGSFVSIRGGVLTIAGQAVKDNKLKAVIIDHCYENAYYEGEYDPEQPQPPVCYAFGRDDKELKPHEKAAKPCSEMCEGCPNNQFGSAEKGKGKACKNIRRLALISADGLNANSAEKSELVYLKLSVMSCKGWAFYVKGLAATLRRPPFGVVTEISVVPDVKAQFKVNFSVIGPVPDEVMGAVMERREKVMDEIMFPYSAPTEPVAKKPAGKRKF